MDNRLLFAALTVENFVALWPSIFLALGSYDNWLVFLVMLPAALVGASSSLAVVGIAKRRISSWRTLNWLMILSVLPIAWTLISLFFYNGSYDWAVQDCAPLPLYPSLVTLAPFKCIIVQGTVYVDLYLLPVLIAAISIFVSILPQYVKSRKVKPTPPSATTKVLSPIRTRLMQGHRMSSG